MTPKELAADLVAAWAVADANEPYEKTVEWVAAAIREAEAAAEARGRAAERQACADVAFARGSHQGNEIGEAILARKG